MDIRYGNCKFATSGVAGAAAGCAAPPPPVQHWQRGGAGPDAAQNPVVVGAVAGYRQWYQSQNLKSQAI